MSIPTTRYITALPVSGLTTILRLLQPKELTSDTTQFDLGYEAAKQTIAKTLAKEMGITVTDTVNTILKHVNG